MKLILASSSPYRRALLVQAGLQFEVRRPDVDEDQLKKAFTGSPVELARHLAYEKAKSIKSTPDEVILGCDQLVTLKGKVFDKPGGEAQAYKQLRQLSGTTHQLITAMSVVWRDRSYDHTDVADIELYPLSDNEIQTYIKLDQPFDCAGSYKLEKAGLLLVKRMHLRDPSAPQGLSLVGLEEALRALDLSASHFWRNTL